MHLESNRGGREGGQIIVLFALSLVAILAFAQVLFTGAQSLVLRRQLQNAGDSAALAGANLLVNVGGCSAAGAGGSPRAAVVTAVRNSVAANIPGYDTSTVNPTCPVVYNNLGVQVDLVGTSPALFGAISLNPRTSSTAINGDIPGGGYSVALLDPANLAWTGHGGRTGCPSYQVDGGVTVTYEGSIMVDSQCTRAQNTSGAVKSGNSAFQMNMINGASMRIGGEAQSQTLTKISPSPTEDFTPLLSDPLSGLNPPCGTPGGTGCLGTTTSLPARNASTNGAGALCNSTKIACILTPGTYTGGISAGAGQNATVLLLRPGIYYVNGGGFTLKSGSARIIAIPNTTGTCGGSGTCSDNNAINRYCNPTNQNNGSCRVDDTTVAANWETDCVPPISASWASSTCGVLIYNAKADTNSGWTTSGASADTITNGSQGDMLLRAYNPSADQSTDAATGVGNGTTFATYKNVVVWQARTPTPVSATTSQPTVSMTGGACVVLSGTVYAAYAQVQFGGSSCGSGGGGDAQMALQFICWDLELAGNNNFYFAYRLNAFANPWAYGLIK